MGNFLTLVGKEEITAGLTIFKFKVSNLDFKPGQWVTLAAEVDDRKILRPYSVASAPYQLPEVELFVRAVIKDGKLGPFTSKLFVAKTGDRFEVVKVGGTFLLDESDKRRKILVASGTGLAPFISMIRHEIKKCGMSDSIVVHGVSYAKDLAYKEELERYTRTGKLIKYIPTISRAEQDASWKGETGRAESLIQNGRIDKILGEEITKEKYDVYACGHPRMVDSVVNFFKGKGFVENKDVKFERYWSEPKKD